MIVVADNSPLNYLTRLGYSDLVREIYGRVIVPSAVIIELQHRSASQEVRRWAFAFVPWSEERSVTHLDLTLATELGMGEREAIELRAGVLLIYERSGRQEANVRKIEVAGTLAVLLEGSLRGYLKLPTELERLRQFKFRSSAEIQASMLDRYCKAGGRP